MEKTDIEKLKYPIGKFHTTETITEDELQKFISDIEKLPAELRNLVSNFSEEQLNTRYREGGWTVKHVVNHMADANMNGYIRFKLGLTEDTPTVKPYYEDKWAELEDANSPVNISLALLDNLHTRWVTLLKSMSKKDFEKSIFHPEHGKEFSLYELTAMYSWHGRHHLAHIKELKKRMNW